MTTAASRRTLVARIATMGLVAALWWSAPPAELTVQTWRLFALFAAAIFSVVVGAFPILTASVFALAAAVLTGLLRPDDAYAGFANGTILLIVVAFLVASAVVKCGLGARGGHWMVSRFGRSTLGLSYSIFLLDAVIAPAFPSNTARSGVLYPAGVVAGRGGRRDARISPDRRRLGAFLMFSGIASLSVSSALWLTAMAANPLGTEVASGFGVEIGFGRWLVASVGADDLRDGAAAGLPLLAHWTRGPEDARRARRRPEGARGARPAHAPGVDRPGRLRRHGRALGVGRDDWARFDRDRVSRPGRRCWSPA